MSIKFCPISSGSDGNSIYIGSSETHILIDAGISGKRITAGLFEAVNISPSELSAIFITHEHVDHIQGVGVLSRKYDIPIFATEKTWTQILRHNMIGAVAEKNRNIIYPEEKCLINDMVILPFDIPHDAAQPVGYCVSVQGRKISVATDLGCITDTLREKLYGSDVILLESNHDLDMLKNGPYPMHLKARIMGNKGHLSNNSAGEFLTDIMCPKLKHIFLGHLSAENNRPLIAYETVRTILTDNKINVGAGREVELYLAQRGGISESLILNSL
ncbi:MAG: MBL fold metallo-hydrolase [Clostridiales bacterium]|jgi:phosphoribosyl 1,2-cyclic phosphodiesterase|nr:MBL fold metallo-hydrolase [Clostridiales bacterium]